MKIGEKYLITTDNWFFAPDGESYRAVFGTVSQVVNAEQALGIATNRNSTNWYVVVGDALLAGCQIHYAVRADGFSSEPATAEIDHDGVRKASKNMITRIYDADRSGLSAVLASSPS